MRHVIRGAGFGHGIGMSQYGAYGYALNGAKYQGILAHYYKDTRLGERPLAPGARAAAAERPLHPRARRHQHRRPHAEAGPHLRGARVRRGDPGTTSSGKRVARVGNGARFGGTRAAAAARAGAQLRVARPLPRRDRAAHRGRRGDGDQRARPRQLRARRGGRRDAQLVAARGAQGPGCGRAHLRARDAQDDRAVRPVPRHPLAGLPRRDRRERAQRRRGARHRRAHRHLRRRAGGDLLLLHLRRGDREHRVLVRRRALEAVAGRRARSLRQQVALPPLAGHDHGRRARPRARRAAARSRASRCWSAACRRGWCAPA